MTPVVMWIVVVAAVLLAVFYGPIKEKLSNKKVDAVKSALSASAYHVEGLLEGAVEDIKAHVTKVATVEPEAETTAEIAGTTGTASTAPQSTSIASKRASLAAQITALQDQDAKLDQLDQAVKKALA